VLPPGIRGETISLQPGAFFVFNLFSARRFGGDGDVIVVFVSTPARATPRTTRAPPRAAAFALAAHDARAVKK
jgi:hypothetical protein